MHTNIPWLPWLYQVSLFKFGSFWTMHYLELNFLFERLESMHMKTIRTLEPMHYGKYSARPHKWQKSELNLRSLDPLQFSKYISDTNKWQKPKLNSRSTNPSHLQRCTGTTINIYKKKWPIRMFHQAITLATNTLIIKWYFSPPWLNKHEPLAKNHHWFSIPYHLYLKSYTKSTLHIPSKCSIALDP